MITISRDEILLIDVLECGHATTYYTKQISKLRKCVKEKMQRTKDKALVREPDMMINYIVTTVVNSWLEGQPQQLFSRGIKVLEHR